MRFRQLEEIHHFGQGLLSATKRPARCEPNAWRAVKSMLENEVEAWIKHGYSQFDPHYVEMNHFASPLRTQPQLEVWKAAGLPSGVEHSAGNWRVQPPQHYNLANLLLTCIGPTKRMTLYVLIIFCCDTGWNLQPMLDLPRNPYLFVTDDSYGVATSAFVHAFKRRAGHDVLAYLERRDPLRGLIKEKVEALWHSVATEFDPAEGTSGYSQIANPTPNSDNSLIGILDRYEAIGRKARAFDIKGRFKDFFFFHLTPRHRVTRTSAMTIYQNRLGATLGRKGVCYRAIRKSYLTLHAHELNSVSATRVVASHASTGVLMPHYTNSEDLRKELDESIRFFQETIQVHAIERSQTAAVHINLPVEHLEWFRSLSVVAGIAPTLGLSAGEANTREPQPKFTFHPTPDRLSELFLIHRALRRTQTLVTKARWQIQGLPLLALVKAIGSTICSSELRTSYITAARTTHRALAEGNVLLPSVMGE
jgi:hypothetical protein